MTTLTQTFLTTDRSVIPAGLAKTMSNIWESANRQYQQRRAIRHFSSLSDLYLKDIGIHRSEITSVICGMNADRLRHSRIW